MNTNRSTGGTMKNWSASSVSVRTLAFALAVIAALPAWAATPADGMACLHRFDIACANLARSTMATGPATTRFDASLAFHLGEFERAATLLQSVAPSFGDEADFQSDLALYTATVTATAGFVTERRGDVEIRYLPGTDMVLVEEAFEVLQAAHDRIAPRLGGAPPGGIRLEIYPTAPRFIAASGIPAEAVRTTGVVALSKWTRLLITSPRALGRGYAWKDTVAHEYIHYVVAWRSEDKAPVWLQEGIARSHETLWREDSFAGLAPYQQSLLANALAKNDLVTLEEMHPSMAYLPTAEDAALAFAQVATMVAHLDATGGPTAVSNALDGVRSGTNPLEAVAAAAGSVHGDAFLESWRNEIASLHLVARKLAALPTVLGGADDSFGIDPVLAKRADLAGHARIGDLLHERELDAAALVEYQKATPADEPPSPLLAARVARSLAALGRAEDAIATLRRSIGDYPEFALTRKNLGDLLLRAGQAREALSEYRASADVNPFDPDVQAAMAQLYASQGDPTRAERHRRYREILSLGGAPPAGAR